MSSVAVTSFWVMYRLTLVFKGFLSPKGRKKWKIHRTRTHSGVSKTAGSRPWDLPDHKPDYRLYCRVFGFVNLGECIPVSTDILVRLWDHSGGASIKIFGCFLRELLGAKLRRFGVLGGSGGRLVPEYASTGSRRGVSIQEMSSVLGEGRMADHSSGAPEEWARL